MHRPVKGPQTPVVQQQQFMDELQLALSKRKQQGANIPNIVEQQRQQKQIPKPPPVPWAQRPTNQQHIQKPEQQKTQKIEPTLSEEQRRIEEELQNLDREAKKLQQVIESSMKQRHNALDEEPSQTVQGKMEAEQSPPLPPMLPPPEFPPPMSLPPPELPILPPILPPLPPLEPQLKPAQQPQDEKLRQDKSWRRRTMSEANLESFKIPPTPNQPTYNPHLTEKQKKRHTISGVKHLGQHENHEHEHEEEKKKKGGFKKLVKKLFS